MKVDDYITLMLKVLIAICSVLVVFDWIANAHKAGYAKGFEAGKSYVMKIWLTSDSLVIEHQKYKRVPESLKECKEVLKRSNIK